MSLFLAIHWGVPSFQHHCINYFCKCTFQAGWAMVWSRMVGGSFPYQLVSFKPLVLLIVTTHAV